jgi:hypothetical protein
MINRLKRCVSVPPESGLLSSNGVGIAASRSVRSRTFPVTARSWNVPVRCRSRSKKPPRLIHSGTAPSNAGRTGPVTIPAPVSCITSSSWSSHTGSGNFVVIDEREHLCAKSSRCDYGRISREWNSAARLGHVFDRPATRVAQRFTRLLRRQPRIVIHHHDRNGPWRTISELESVEPLEQAGEPEWTTMRRNTDRDRRRVPSGLAH